MWAKHFCCLKNFSKPLWMKGFWCCYFGISQSFHAVYNLIPKSLPMFPTSELWTKVWLLWNNGQISHRFPESQGQRLSDPHSWAACSGVKGFCYVARVIKRMNSLLSVVPANICGIRLALFTFNSRSRWKVAVKGTWAFQDSYLPLVWVRVCVNC